jgi:hypothetical protein
LNALLSLFFSFSVEGCEWEGEKKGKLFEFTYLVGITRKVRDIPNIYHDNDFIGNTRESERERDPTRVSGEKQKQAIYSRFTAEFFYFSSS